MKALALTAVATFVLFPCISSFAGELPTSDRMESLTCQCANEASSISVTYADPGFQEGDYLTIAPDATGESLGDRGVTITLTVMVCNATPLVGVPHTALLLFDPGLAPCGAFWSADGPTDANGVTTFTGTLAGGGCASELMVFVDGCYIGTVPIGVNSPDRGTSSPGFVDSADVAALALRVGSMAAWDICFDYNESGPPIDSSDVAYLAGFLGASCP